MNVPESDRPHAIRLDGRAELSISGIDDVISFDESSIALQTSMGLLTIDGSELHIVRLNVEKGEAAVSGKVNGLFYVDKGTGKRSARKHSGLFG